MKFEVHTKDSAPKGAEETIDAAIEKFGFLPNLIGVMAEAPALAEAYIALNGIFGKSSLTPTEQQVVLLSASYVNNCTYCMAAHSVVASMQNVPGDVVGALRAGKPIADAKLEALRGFTASVTESRGWPAEDVTQEFIAAGYTKANALEVVLGVALKTISNYTNHLADTPLDDAFKSVAWEKAA